jgi:RNA polymerase sigma-70 factor (ECF subfamily)
MSLERDVPSQTGFRIEISVLSRPGAAAGDSELGRALAAGDIEALAVLYDRFGAIAYAVAVRVLGDKGLAEDVVQECFLKIWNNAGSFDPARGSLRSWLLTSVRNRAVDELRGRSTIERHEALTATLDLKTAIGRGGDPWGELSASMQRDVVKQALNRLPVEQRQAVELAYYGGYTYRQIAEIGKVPVSTIKGRMRLALEKLHSYLDGKGLVNDF